MGSELSFLPYTYFSMTHGIMLGKHGESMCFCLLGLPRLKNVFEVLRLLK